jgi:hypothetical protein
MHTSKIPVIVLALIGLAGCLMPWVQTLKFGETAQINGLCFAEGGFGLTIFFLMGFVSFFKTRTGNILNSYYKTVLVLSSIILAVTLYKFVSIKEQTARMASYEIDIKGIVQYYPATGLIMSMSAAAAITLYMAVQLYLRYRKVLVPLNWQTPASPGRFYLPAHHNTTL